jgi:acetyltransferase-like isoleucine patch superfamily enzyme
MLGMKELIERRRFWASCDRIGPDILSSHWRLFFPTLMTRLCTVKFRHFGLGAEFRPGAYAIMCSKISIGAHVVVRPGTMLFADPREGAGHIVIEDDALLGSAIHIYTSNHAFSNPGQLIIAQGHCRAEDVVIRRGAWVGAGAIILPGVTIGENAVVGAGSVVTRSVPDFCLAMGNPARVTEQSDPGGSVLELSK